MKRKLAALLVAFILALGCGRSDGAGTAGISEGSPTPRPRPLPPVAKSSADVNDPVFSVGQEVFITDDGFVPQQLVAIVGEKISFVNETNDTAEVRFSAIDFATGPIEPGERATYTPEGAYSIGYHVAGDKNVTGAIQVQAYFMPGEDPAAEDRLDADTPGEETAP